MDWGPFLVAAASALTGIISALFTWLATRPKAQADAYQGKAQAELTGISGFQILVAELQKERVQLAAVIEKQAGQIEKASGEIERLREEVAGLRTDLDDVMARWRRGEAAPAPAKRSNRS